MLKPELAIPFPSLQSHLLHRTVIITSGADLVLRIEVHFRMVPVQNSAEKSSMRLGQLFHEL